MGTKSKPKNQADATLRNVRAAHTREAALVKRVTQLEAIVASLARRVAELEDAALITSD